MLRLAVSSLTFEGFRESNFEHLFEKAAAFGCRYVELNCWYPKSILPENIKRIKRGCENSGLTPIALHVSGFGGSTSELLTANTAHKMRALEAAAELGCRRVVASAMQSCQHLDEIAKELDALAKETENMDMLLCLENHCQNILAVSKDYQYLFERINSPHICACLDGGHLEAAGETIDAFIQVLDRKILHLHLKENLVFGKKTFCRFGNGGTDNEAMIQKMLRRGYSGYMSIELSPEIDPNGNAAEFTDEERKLPITMFSKYERG